MSKLPIEYDVALERPTVGSNVNVAKRGNMVTIALESASVIDNNGNIVTLPVELRPVFAIRGFARVTDGSNFYYGYVTIANNGNVSASYLASIPATAANVKNCTTGFRVLGTFTYIT